MSNKVKLETHTLPDGNKIRVQKKPMSMAYFFHARRITGKK